MIQTFGDVINEPPNYQEYILLEISPSPTIPIAQRWPNNSLSADFLADYLSNFLPNHVVQSKDLKGTISYITNELLENALKFNDHTSQHSIRIKLGWQDNHLFFFVTNSLSSQTMATFQANIQMLTSQKPHDLWVQQVTNNLEEDNKSGVGLLTMFLDYDAKVCWQFETFQTEPQVIIVTTIVQLAI